MMELMPQPSLASMMLHGLRDEAFDGFRILSVSFQCFGTEERR